MNQPYGLPYGADAEPDDAPAPVMLYGVTGAGVLMAGMTYKGAFSKRASAARSQARVSYGLALVVAALGAYKLYQQGDLSLGDGWGFDGYGGVSKKIARLSKKIARLEKRLEKKESKGRTKATMRIQRRIDKLQAKLNALNGQASGEGIPGYPGTPSPGQPMMDPMMDAGGYVEPSGMPTWALPAAVGGGLLLVLGAVMLSGGRE